MRVTILILLLLIWQGAPKPKAEQIESLIVVDAQDNERDPEDVKYEHELWKRVQGKYWRAENDPSKWPKFMRSKTNSEHTGKELWQVESVYTIKDNDSCKRLAKETVLTYGDALEEAQVTIDEHICHFFVRIGPTSAELMSHDKRIRRVREVDDSFPLPSRSVPLLLKLQPQPFGKPQLEWGEKPKLKRP